MLLTAVVLGVGMAALPASAAECLTKAEVPERRGSNVKGSASAICKSVDNRRLTGKLWKRRNNFPDALVNVRQDLGADDFYNVAPEGCAGKGRYYTEVELDGTRDRDSPRSIVLTC